MGAVLCTCCRSFTYSKTKRDRLFADQPNKLSMQLTEKERLLLVSKKEEITKLTQEIIELTIDIKKNKTEIKKKVEAILSLISTIACYTNSNLDMQPFALTSQVIFHQMDNEKLLPKTITTELELFCSVVNSLKFKFLKNGLMIQIDKIGLFNL
jgi:L-fucose isomerase-like protein